MRPSRKMVVSPAAKGAAIRSEETYWLLPMSRRTIFPPARQPPRIVIGGYPLSWSVSIPTPWAARAFRRGFIGLSHRRRLPVSTIGPSPREAIPASRRIAVPLFPRSILRCGAAILPPVPRTVICAPSVRTSAPRRRSASARSRVSSESRGSRRTDSPSASAAMTIARCV